MGIKEVAETNRIMAIQDDIFISVNDGKGASVDKLVDLPPWRAYMIAKVCARAGALSWAIVDAIYAEAGEIGGKGTLTIQAIQDRLFK